MCECMCVSLTRLNYKRITYLKCLSFYDWKQAVSLRLEKVSVTVFLRGPSILLLFDVWKVLPLRRNCVKRNAGRNSCADVVLSRSRGSPGQWFPRD